MTNLSVFHFDSQEIEIVIIDGNPLFNGSQSAKALGYSNASKALQDNVSSKYNQQLDLGRPGKKPNFISEPGLYQLIMRSNLPSAERFQDWVFEEVLPSIRKNGEYAVKTLPIEKTPAQIAEQVIAETETVLNWTIQTLGLDETIGKLMKVDMVADLLPHLKPSLEPVKQHLSAADPIEAVGMTATQLGEHLNPKKKAKEVNTLLEQIGLQYKMYRTSTKSGKQKYSWQVTEEGQKHSTVHKVTNGNSDWNGNQIKWQMSAVQLVQDYLDNATV